VDHFESTCSEQEFLLNYLGDSSSGEHIDAPQHLADFPRWNALGAPQKIDYAAQYLLRLRVLDIFMDTIAGYRHPNITTVPRSPLPSFPRRIQGVHKSLSDWTQCVSRFLSMFDAHDPDPQDIPHPGSQSVVTWKTPENSPTPKQSHPVDDLAALEQLMLDYSPPLSSPNTSPLPHRLPTKNSSPPSPSNLSALIPYMPSLNMAKRLEFPGMSASSPLPNFIVSAGVERLLSCQRHHAEASKHKVLFNLELAAFALSWMAMVCCCQSCVV
jgi:hypothetical protein